MILKSYLKAGFPALWLETPENNRALEMIQCPGWNYYSWNCVDGLSEIGTAKPIDETLRDPVEAIRWLDNFQDTVLAVQNMHLFLGIPEVITAIQNGVTKWKATGSCLVIIAPTLNLGPELEKLFTVIDLPLPTEQELYDLQCEIGKDCQIEPNYKSAQAARGLTESEAEAAYALSAVEEGQFSASIISSIKSQNLRKTGLSYYEPASIDDIGGLSIYKSYIKTRAKAFEPDNYNLPKPKAQLLIGIPGTGKSLCAKASASILGFPLIMLDLASLKSSLIGESERKLRFALRTLNSFGQAVVWIDEIEKMFAGVGSNNDSGVSSAMFATFLTWLQETKAPVLVMATANDIRTLPPEILRAGRFDSIWFLDLPTSDERKELIGIMNRRYGSDIPLSLVDKLNGWTPAEIEQLSKDSRFDGIEKAYQAIVPLSKTMKEQITALREWARTRARIANTPEPEIETSRKVRGPKIITTKGPSNPILN